jgi:hypothetical protein
VQLLHQHSQQIPLQTGVEVDRVCGRSWWALTPPLASSCIFSRFSWAVPGDVANHSTIVVFPFAWVDLSSSSTLTYVLWVWIKRQVNERREGPPYQSVWRFNDRFPMVESSKSRLSSPMVMV